MGWRKANIAATLHQVTKEQRQEMGARMRALMDRRNLTNQALAYKSGVAEKTISRMKNGRHEPRFGTLESVAEALGITVADLVPDEDPAAPDLLGRLDPEVRTRLDRIELALLDLMERQKAIQRLLDEWAAAAVERAVEQAQAEASGTQPAPRSGPSTRRRLAN